MRKDRTFCTRAVSEKLPSNARERTKIDMGLGGLMSSLGSLSSNGLRRFGTRWISGFFARRFAKHLAIVLQMSVNSSLKLRVVINGHYVRSVVYNSPKITLKKFHF